VRFLVRKAIEMGQSGSQPVFAARSDVRNGVARITVEGELDFATVPEFKRCLVRARAEADGHGPPHLLLDLRGLAFMDSSGLGALLAAAGGASKLGREFATLGVNDSVRKVMDVTGTSRLLLDGSNTLGLIETFMAPDGEAEGR
jgi:anti-anti-sigma factor